MSHPGVSSVSTPVGHLDAEALARVDARLAATDEHLESSYPGEDGRRQPVHTVYVAADRYTADLPERWGSEADRLVRSHGGYDELARRLVLPGSGDAGGDEELAGRLAERVRAKLAGEPIEDLRLDFEDGYGNRGDKVEDADVIRAATELAAAVRTERAPAFVGLRFKCFEAPTRHRGIRTFDLFLSTLLAAGDLPQGLVVTFPKVSTVSQVEAMVEVCETFESAAGLAPGRIGFEIQVETPQLVLGSDGRIPVAAAIAAGGGRVTALHYGTYDYSASLQIAPPFQAMDHPAADFAKQVMQVAVAGTGVHLSDGSTNVVPVGGPEQVWAAWRLHHDLVTRSLGRGYYQGWDLHPGQLPTRYLATFAFYRREFASATARLATYARGDDSAIMDEPATARALARYLHRGRVCGAVEESELQQAAGLRDEQIEALARPRSDTEHLVDADHRAAPRSRA